jgi:hypothetical protein
MSKKPSDARPVTSIQAHVERAISVVTGLPINIRCECPLGHDHTYAEWRERFSAGAVKY